MAIVHLTSGETVHIEGSPDEVAPQIPNKGGYASLEVEDGGGEQVVIYGLHVTYIETS